MLYVTCSILGIPSTVFSISHLGNVNNQKKLSVYQSNNLIIDLNILDLIGIANLIIGGGAWGGFDYTLWASDLNMDADINIQDIVTLVNIILEN